MASSVTLNSGRRLEAVSISGSGFCWSRGDILSVCTWGHFESNILWCLPVSSSDGWQKCGQTKWAYPTGVSVCLFVWDRKRNVNNAQYWLFRSCLMGSSTVYFRRLWSHWGTSIILFVHCCRATTVRSKGRNLRIKAPMCRALKKLCDPDGVCERDTERLLYSLLKDWFC